MRKTLLTMSVLMLLILSSCVSYYRGGLSTPAIPEMTETPEGISAPIFYGYGLGATRGAAEDQAIRNALVRASLIALQDQAVLFRDNVESLFSRNVRLGSYIISSSLEQVDWDLDNGSYEMIISIRVLLPEVSRLLRENDISGGLVRDNLVLRMEDRQTPSYAPSTKLSEVLEPVGSRWEDVGYKPTFLVYYDERQVADPFTARMAVQTANGYLSSIGFPYVDLGQIESIKLDQEYAFQEETGSSSMLRQIASRLHADYYIDMAVSSSTFSRSGSYYAEVSVLLSAYDSSTASGRGSMFVQSEEPVRGATRNAAIDRAVSEAVEEAMADIMEKTAVYFVQDADRGQSFELIIMKSYQDKVVRALEQLIAEQVETFRRISFSPEESRYSIQYSGGIDDLIEIVYESSEIIPELQRIYLVYQRGNSITFHTGW